jgi:dihydropteroate synthase
MPERAREIGLALTLGPRTFGPDERVVMAIVNRTTDSFYAGARTFDLDAALGAVDRAVRDGAAIVDIGGVKAGDGPDVSVGEEIDRVVPVVAATRARHPGLVISVDTWRAEVATAVVGAGADLLNDAWGGVDARVADVAAASGVGLVCTHTNGIAPRSLPMPASYPDVMYAIRSDLQRQVGRALEAGVRPDGIIVDPGHDFGKNTFHSLEATRRLDELVADGWPVLVALSRKDFVGETLDRPIDDRLPGTLAAVAACALSGARIFRAHDVAATVDVLRMLDAIDGRRPPAAPSRGLIPQPSAASS